MRSLENLGRKWIRKALLLPDKSLLCSGREEEGPSEGSRGTRNPRRNDGRDDGRGTGNTRRQHRGVQAPPSTAVHGREQELNSTNAIRNEMATQRFPEVLSFCLRHKHKTLGAVEMVSALVPHIPIEREREGGRGVRTSPNGKELQAQESSANAKQNRYRLL